MNATPAVQLELTYLTAPNCRLCVHGRAVLDDLAIRLPISIREVDLLSEEGRQLVAVGRVPFPPALFLDGRAIAHGRLSARRLERQLQRHLIQTGA